MASKRNDPCPCGSGKKYKKCCLHKDEQLNPVTNELKDAMQQETFESLEHAQAFAERHVEQANNTQRADLNGYSPNQISQLLRQPLEEQTLLQWCGTLSKTQLMQSPIYAVYEFLQTYLANNSCKATPKGNFPTVLVKEAWADFKQKFPKAADVEHIQTVSREDKFRELHILRIVLQESGLLRKYKGEFKLTKKALNKTPDEQFRQLFEGYIYNYNWAYEDGYPEEPFFQESVFYSLVELNRVAQQTIAIRTFSDSFMDTFPMATQYFSHDGYGVASDYAKNAFDIRVVQRFLAYFGFVEVQGKIFTRDYERFMQATPLLQQTFEFTKR